MIRFSIIKWKNFLSTGGQFTEIKLDRSPTTLIVGENGAGKSTILDAICFALFGKPFRNINKPQLMNSINGKLLIVEVEFSIGSKNYKIVRGMKPGIFEIYQDDILLNQDSAVRDYQKYLEEQILKLNYKSFTQIVILGSASFTPFMQLPQGHRREIIEDILDIQIFSVMNTVLKNKLNDLKENIKKLEGQIELGKHKVKIQQDYIKTLEDDQRKRQDNVQQLIDQTNEEITRLTTEIDNKTTSMNALTAKIEDEKEQQNAHTQLQTLGSKLLDKIKSAQNNIQFYHNNDTCPTCNQELNEDHKTHAVDNHSSKIEEIKKAMGDLDVRLKTTFKRLEEIKVIKTEISEISSNIIRHNNEVIGAQAYIKKLTSELSKKNEEVNSLDGEKVKLKDMAREVVNLAGEKAKENEDKFYHEAAGSLLKDTGIKTKIIKQYLPVINKLVNKYLTAMDFFCSFELDESFNESIKSRHRDNFSYASFSEGEKQRIDLALLFTWRTIAKMKNSASTNLLLLDEVFDSSLDINGTDYVMQLLNTVGEETNVFVISHKGDQLFDKFRSIIKFEKHQNYSRIVK